MEIIQQYLESLSCLWPRFKLYSILYLSPSTKRRGRQVIRISVFDFSSFKGLFVNVGRWWLRLYCGRLVLSGAPLILPQFGPRVSEEEEEEGVGGGVGGWDIVNLSGGEWGHGVSVKWSTGFLDRGWRIYSHCGDKCKDLTHIWIPPSVCVPLSGRVCSQNNWVKLYYSIAHTEADTFHCLSRGLSLHSMHYLHSVS